MHYLLPAKMPDLMLINKKNRTCHLVDLLYSYLNVHASQRHNITDRRMNKRRMIMTQEGCRKEDTRRLLFKIYTSHFIARFACERMLEIECKLHILTPLLWPSRCVFLNLLILNRGHGVHSAGCWLPLFHIISIFSGPQLIRASSPFGRVGPSLPHLVSNSLGSAGNCIGGFRGPPRSGVAFPTTPRL